MLGIIGMTGKLIEEYCAFMYIAADFKRPMSHFNKILLLIFTLLVCQNWSAQVFEGRSRYKRSAQVFDVKFGGTVGIDRSWLKGDDYIVRPNSFDVGAETFTKFKGRYAYHAGVYLDFQFSERNFAQLGIKWVKKGWKQEGPFRFSPYNFNLDSSNVANKVEVVYDITYIEIPIRYKYKLSKEWYFAGGPYFGFSLNEKYKTTDDFGVNFAFSEGTKSHYVQFNYGLNLGFIYQMNNGLNFAVEYQHGFADINDYGEIKDVDIPKNNLVTGSLSVGYTLNYFDRRLNPRSRRKGLL